MTRRPRASWSRCGTRSTFRRRCRRSSRIEDVVAHVTKIVADAPDLFSQEVIGQSNEGRTLHHVWFGKGATHILLWSQMHGDEPTATSALFDLHHYIRLHRAEPIVKRMLDNLTIHVVPMLNPDGAERYQRRNVQDIDINRDAVRLQTPEGRALKALRDRINPVLGFNLHNQNWGTSVGFPPKPASISLLAVSFNRERTDNEKRILAKKTSAIIREAIEPLIPGQIGRYDDEFEVRAFGDNIAKWGTGVVLIETGPAPGDEPDKTLIRANFVALVTALDALASGRVKKADREALRDAAVQRVAPAAHARHGRDAGRPPEARALHRRHRHRRHAHRAPRRRRSGDAGSPAASARSAFPRASPTSAICRPRARSTRSTRRA